MSLERRRLLGGLILGSVGQTRIRPAHQQIAVVEQPSITRVKVVERPPMNNPAFDIEEVRIAAIAGSHQCVAERRLVRIVMG